MGAGGDLGGFFLQRLSKALLRMRQKKGFARVGGYTRACLELTQGLDAAIDDGHTFSQVVRRNGFRAKYLVRSARVAPVASATASVYAAFGESLASRRSQA